MSKQMWVMSNEIVEGCSYLTNGKWYALIDGLTDGWFRVKADDDDIVDLLERGSSLTKSGEWNFNFADPHEDEIQQDKFTDSIVEGLQEIIDAEFDCREQHVRFLKSLIDKLRSGEYTITHEI